MPFQSEKQRRYLWANEPKIARDWTDRYGARGGGMMRVPLANGSFKNWLKNKSGYTQHNIDNQKLRNALDTGEITEKQYKLMGGWDVAKNMPLNLGSNYKNVGIASGLYNALKSGVSAFTGSPDAQYGDIGPLESIALNTQGATGLGKKNQMMYDDIVGGKKFFSNENEMYNNRRPDKIKAMRQDLRSVPNHMQRQTSFPTATAQQFANLGSPQQGFKKSGMALKNPAKDPYEAPSGLASLMKGFKTKTGEGWDFAKQLPGMAMSAVSGIPGLGFLLSSIKPDPRDKYLGDPYSMKNYRGKNYGYGDTLRHGNLTGQDQFGINTRSLFGDYQGHYGKFMNKMNKKIAMGYKPKGFQKDKYDFAQDVTGTKKDSPNITGTPLITSTSIHHGPDTPEDKSGWASPGGGGAPSHRTRTLMEKGGRASYFDGGLLSLWPR